jgi:hypothetical protein
VEALGHFKLEDRDISAAARELVRLSAALLADITAGL